MPKGDIGQSNDERDCDTSGTELNMSFAEMFNREEVRKGRTEELDESHAQSGV